MSKDKLIPTALLFFYFLLPAMCAASGNVVINEIAWMGTPDSASDEWVELYNNSLSSVSVDGWTLKWGSGKVNIELSGLIKPKGFFILERTDDSTLPQIKADIIYKGALKNSGEHLKLINPKGIVEDEVNFENGWLEGDNDTKATLERKDPRSSGLTPKNWQSSARPGGTPGKKNSPPHKKLLPASKQSNPRFSASLPKRISRKGSFILAALIALASAIAVFEIKTGSIRKTFHKD